jgi:hypothetical protein
MEPPKKLRDSFRPLDMGIVSRAIDRNAARIVAAYILASSAMPEVTLFECAMLA